MRLMSHFLFPGREVLYLIWAPPQCHTTAEQETPSTHGKMEED